MNIAMISKWHVHAVDYQKHIQSREDCKIVAVWDDDKERGEKWADELGVKFYADYDELLANDDIDAVIICSSTNIHTELMIKAANAKKHIFTEKVLTLTYEDALKVKKAVEDNGIIFTISFPHRTRKSVMKAKEMVDSGAIGDLTYARVRNVHSGAIKGWLPKHFYVKETCGGGAMVDLGAHPMYLLQYFLGEAKKVSSVFTNVTAHDVEDNAVSVIEFENNAIGVSETGFVSVFDPFSIELSGTAGKILVKGADYLEYANSQTEGNVVSVELDSEQYLPVHQWVDSIKNGTPNEFGIECAVELTKLMEAAYKAYESGSACEV